MGGEIPFAGHPSLGVAVAVARLRGESQVTYVQRTQAGEQAVDVELDGLHASVSMLQEPPTYGPELDPDDVLGLVGLDGSEADPSLPCQVVSTGVPQVVACVARRRRAAPRAPRLRPHRAAARAARRDRALPGRRGPGDRHGARPLVHALGGDGRGPGHGLRGRPAVRPRGRAHGVERLDVDQGSEMGRPSRLAAAVDGDRIRVGGDAVIVAEGTVHLLDT